MSKNGITSKDARTTQALTPNSTSAQVEIENLRDLLKRTVRPHTNGPTYALIDFPDYFNPGDCAIWLGQTQVLRALTGHHPTMVASIYSFNSDKLRKLPQSAPIFMQGGGNLGDLWPAHQVFRERILAETYDRKIVVLTQSINFNTKKGIEKAKRSFGNHPDITLLLRDQQSLDFARSNFNCQSSLCPDFALALDLRRTPTKQKDEIFWLIRSDKESAGIQPRSLGDKWKTSDWPNPSILRRSWLHRFPFLPDQTLRAFAQLLSHARLQKGLSLFCDSGAVITDRLHGHVLSTVLGIPNILLPDSFGKNRGLYETWTHRIPGCGFSESPEDAVKQLGEWKSL